MGDIWARHRWEMMNAYKNLVGKSERNRQLANVNPCRLKNEAELPTGSQGVKNEKKEKDPQLPLLKGT